MGALKLIKAGARLQLEADIARLERAARLLEQTGHHSELTQVRKDLGELKKLKRQLE